MSTPGHNPRTGKDSMPLLYGTIFLVSCATLMVQVALMRIFSVIMWYHFSFLVISVALLGFGASGALLTVFKRSFEENFEQMSIRLTTGFSVACIVNLLIIGRIQIDPFQILHNPSDILELVILCITLIILFIFAGLFSGLMMVKVPERIGKIYFVNLAGSGVGCLVAIPAIPLLANSGLVVVSAAAGAASALLLGLRREGRKSIILRATWLVVLIVLAANARTAFKFQVSTSKGMSINLAAGEEVLGAQWNVFSQVEVMSANSSRYGPGLSSNSVTHIPEQKFIYIDQDALTPITSREGPESDLDFLHFIPSSTAYQLKPGAKVCVIGAGGGIDVLSALHSGKARHVTGVEINPLVSGFVKGPFAEFSGNLYTSHNVLVVNEDGRSFIANTAEKYDIIQMSLVDTWAAASSAAYSLTENYLYTSEAFQSYLEHLNEDGILTVTRWYLSPPIEVLKLIAITDHSLRNIGVKAPETQIAVVRSDNVAVLLIKRIPFTETEINRVRSICTERNFEILHVPGFTADNLLSQFLNEPDKEKFKRECPFNIDPPNDDRPFYFQNAGWKHIFDVGKNLQVTDIDRNKISYVVLAVVLLQSIVLSAAFILLPLWLSRRTKHPDEIGLRNGSMMLGYFALLGLAFMFVEVTLIQKFVLFLGQPVYSFSVVLFSLLVSAGLGSLWTTRMEHRISYRQTAVVLAILSLLICGYAVLLQHLSLAFLGWKLLVRCAMTIALILPLGFLMGMPFPLMLRLAGKENANLIPWCWGINGCFSVISSVLCVIIAMKAGFSSVMFSAALCYGLACVIVMIHQSRQEKNAMVATRLEPRTN